jgi:RHS repeat-associated protein
VHTYSYGYDPTWKDKLVSYDGMTVTSDEIGNTTQFNGWTYTWEAGRQLKQMSDGSTTLQFKYDDAGLRTQKVNGGTTTQYYWAGSNISHMTSGSDTLHFWYDAAGSPAMLTYNGTNYYYKHNLQSDIIGLMDMAGSEVVSYTYDAWGRQLSCTGTLATTLGAANPLRYRGYILDSEIGLYYLQSRYYNPDWGRFVNADNIVAGMGGTNLYQYCMNNHVNMSDSSGHLAQWIGVEAPVGAWRALNAANQSFDFNADFSASSFTTKILIASAAAVSMMSGSATAEEVADDFNDYCSLNNDEGNVLGSSVFSSYKGVPVIRHEIPGITSFSIMGTIVLNKSEDISNGGILTVKHEYGHSVQQSLVGTSKYISHFAIPSVIMCIIDPPYNIYYSMPWERSADMFGGANRGEDYYIPGSELGAGIYLMP